MNRRVFGASFLVVSIFVTAYIAAYFFIQYQPWFRLSTSFQPAAIAFALLIVIPLILAFLWDRIVRANILGIEVEFDKVKIDKLETEKKQFSLNIFKETTLSPIADQKIIKVIVQEIQKIRLDKIIILINLDDGGYGWSVAHLYLLAALLEDFTGVQQIVFVIKRKAQKVKVIGFARPISIRRAIAREFSVLEKVYRMAYLNSISLDAGAIDAKIENILGECFTAINSNNIEYRNFNSNELNKLNEAWGKPVTIGLLDELNMNLVNNSIEAPDGQILDEYIKQSSLEQIVDKTRDNIDKKRSSSTRFLAVTHGEDLLIVDLLKLTVDVVDGVLKADKKSKAAK